MQIQMITEEKVINAKNKNEFNWREGDKCKKERVTSMNLSEIMYLVRTKPMFQVASWLYLRQEDH